MNKKNILRNEDTRHLPSSSPFYHKKSGLRAFSFAYTFGSF